MRAFLRWVLARVFPVLWVLSSLLGFLALAWFLMAPTENMTGRKGADRFALGVALGCWVAAPVLHANRDHFE